MRRWRTILSACRCSDHRLALRGTSSGIYPCGVLQQRIRLASTAAHDAGPLTLGTGAGLSHPQATTAGHVAEGLLEAFDALRDGRASATDANTAQIRKILSEALEKGTNGLHDLAIKHGRWSDVVAIARHLLRGSQVSSQSESPLLYQTVERTTRAFSLDKLTDNSIAHRSLEVPTKHGDHRFDASFEESLDGSHLNQINGLDEQQHKMLGLLWSALGTMTIACINDKSVSGGAVRPEILEILALFHHHGLISPAVYSFTHNSAQDAVQQPIVLHLLSSHIIVALSDAEARAKDLQAIVSAQAAGENTASMHFELRGTSMRTTTEAVKPELWLELILWSCLHGGWASAGLNILDVLCKQSSEHAWTAIPWRARLRELMPFDNAQATDWESLKFDLDTRRSSRADKSLLPGLNTTRTISSEVVTAFVDTFTSHSDYFGSIRGVPKDRVIAWLIRIRSFLVDADVTLQSGSWSAVAQRLIDNHVLSPETLDDVQSLLALTPRFGQEPSAIKTSDLPEYVFDGNAALLGFLHRALRAQIGSGNLSGAEGLSQLIEICTNEARMSSVVDFFESQRAQASKGSHPSDSLFTSNFNGIEYPLFDAQIPTSTVASYIDLLAETRSADKARDILSPQHSGSVFVPRRFWSDSNISGALFRLATALGDEDMLRRLEKGGHGNSRSGKTSLQEQMNDTLMSHLETNQWLAAAQLMLDMRHTHAMRWKAKCLASAGRSLIISSATETSTVGWSVFEAMSSDIETYDLGKMHRDNRSRLLYSIMCLLAIIDERMATILAKIQGPTAFYCPPVDVFNVVVDAVAQAKSNRAARDLTSQFLSARLSNANLVKTTREARAKHQRSNIRSHDQHIPIVTADGRELLLRSTLEISFTTLRLVIQHGLQEWYQSSAAGRSNVQDTLSPQELRQWAEDVLTTVKAPYISSMDILRELDGMFNDSSMPSSDLYHTDEVRQLSQ